MSEHNEISMVSADELRTLHKELLQKTITEIENQIIARNNSGFNDVSINATAIILNSWEDILNVLEHFGFVVEFNTCFTPNTVEISWK